MSCKIDKGVAFDCDALQQGGILEHLYIMNYSEWRTATVTLDATSEEISAIALTESGAAAFKITVPKSANIIPTSVLRVIDGVDGFDDQIDFRIASVEQLDRNNFARMRFNRVVIIAVYVDGRAQLYGGRVNSTPSAVGVGMRLSATDDNQMGSSLGGTLQYVVKTPESGPPEVLPGQLIAADVDLEALLTPVI